MRDLGELGGRSAMGPSTAPAGAAEWVNSPARSLGLSTEVRVSSASAWVLVCIKV